MRRQVRHLPVVRFAIQGDHRRNIPRMSLGSILQRVVVNLAFVVV